MIEQKYPVLEINLKYLQDNVEAIKGFCDEKGIAMAGVIKGTTGLPQVAKVYADGGANMIASSRLEQIEDAIEYGVDLPCLLLRVPMKSELKDAVRLCKFSLQSEIDVIDETDAEAKRQGKVHHIILMADLGDLREGFWGKDELVRVAKHIEDDLDNVYLAGVGTNLGCYGSVVATPEKLSELVEIAEKVEEAIGRKLDYIGGGATSSIPRLLEDNMPERINLLRIGEGIILARDLDIFYGYDMSFMHQDVFSLKAEVIEVKNKPSHPVGEISIDAFGQKQTYEDRGIRKRALIAIGKVDYGSFEDIFPKMKGVEIVGASSDHTILDIEEAEEEIKVGDVLEFAIDYASMVYLTNCKGVRIAFV